MNSLYHYNKLRTELTSLQRRRDQRLEDLVRLKRKARECGERHIGRKLTNAHVLSFFEEFRNETKEGGKWQFIREERSALLTRFGHTKTYVYIITLLQERAVKKYAKSRERHCVTYVKVISRSPKISKSNPSSRCPKANNEDTCSGKM